MFSQDGTRESPIISFGPDHSQRALNVCHNKVHNTLYSVNKSLLKRNDDRSDELLHKRAKTVLESEAK